MERNEAPVRHGDSKMVVGSREVIGEMVRTGEVRAIGKYHDLGQGMIGLPVVYVSKRAKPWYAKRWVHFTSVIVGLFCLLLFLAYWAIMTFGPALFFGGVVASAMFVAWLVRFSRGGVGRGQYVDVTTTTRVRARR